MDERDIKGMLEELLIDIFGTDTPYQGDRMEDLMCDMMGTVKEHLAMAGVDYYD